ncbi:MAG: redox-sensing transcriptional repressor Rex [Candidatus Omnitrophica bacterium]|nr:redox-sensing transcriptional repressor Rex [Candidatus Omnitrophota bacterium]
MISKQAIARLSIYKRSLQLLRESGVEQVSSQTLGRIVGINPAQIRKDLAYLGSFGVKKVGYNTDRLVAILSQALGVTEVQKVILVGAGNIGRALLSYKGFAKQGINIVAAFDIDPAKRHGEGFSIPVYPLDKMRDFIRKSQIRIAVIAVPAQSAQEVADNLVSAGIRGILNFAPIAVSVPPEVIVSYVNLATELERLVYFVSATDIRKTEVRR